MPNQRTQFKKIPAQEWPGIISACKNSGQSQKAFCEERGIGFLQFKYHYYRTPKKTGDNDLLNLDRTKIEDNAPALFAPIKITNNSVDSCTEICFPSGVKIKVPGQTALASIVKALSAYL